jgi:hypothetical protein
MYKVLLSRLSKMKENEKLSISHSLYNKECGAEAADTPDSVKYDYKYAALSPSP